MKLRDLIKRKEVAMIEIAVLFVILSQIIITSDVGSGIRALSWIMLALMVIAFVSVALEKEDPKGIVERMEELTMKRVRQYIELGIILWIAGVVGIIAVLSFADAGMPELQVMSFLPKQMIIIWSFILVMVYPALIIIIRPGWTNEKIE